MKYKEIIIKWAREYSKYPVDNKIKIKVQI
jgi:hypothetical protein